MTSLLVYRIKNVRASLYLAHGQPEATDDGCWVDLVPDKVIGPFQDFSSNNDN